MNTRLRTLSLATVTGLLFCSGALAQVKNGHFEVGPSGIAPPRWTEVGGVIQAPPEGAGAGGPGVNSAAFTLGAGVDLGGGVRGAAIAQRFRCGPPNPQATCYVKLDYAYDEQPMNSASKAFVFLSNASGSQIVELPDNMPGGPHTVQVGILGCGKVTIKIGLIEVSVQEDFASLLLVDHVVAKCDFVPFDGIPELDMTPFTPSAGTPVSDLLIDLCDEMGAWQDLGHARADAAGNQPHLAGSGDLSPGSSSALHLTGLVAGAPLIIIAGLSEAYIPHSSGATIVPQPQVVVTTVAPAATLTLPIVVAAAMPTDVDLYVQAFQAIDLKGIEGNDIAASNALWGVTP